MCYLCGNKPPLMKPDLQKIKTLIKQSGMSYHDVAAKIGVTHGTVSQTLNGWKTVSKNMMEKYASLLGVDVYELYAPTDIKGLEIPEGETYIQCPCCGSLVGVSLHCVKIKDPDDPFPHTVCKKQ